ncbi:DNA replication and repair protein RecN [Anseongella ginsenosidimutans]|uniref:DNA repair protein RecN n=1 Tax=Anseongella ginsenosidimutans TaxID=496056 RepID=A0A4R3KM06_9SPHI|nr:DNA repair protein RecN [Anseongella ginsenosidimutans]QEC54016.1 DNA repair protein RecN [Anseongella ginsenosidimutans]TCS85222.1 DNA replication and repair protein RecN [Anseongella ginsenosidimutans]
MLTRLAIKNYTIIDELGISFSPGLNIITGETGAGKSIIIGALGLILGDRADKKSLHTAAGKCVIEGSFQIAAYGLQDFFSANDLDYDAESTLRREITAEGKSRAFINDTPVTLNQLKELGEKLVDIHSQHQTRQLNTPAFQLMVVDSFAGHEKMLQEYGEKFRAYRKLEARLEDLEERARTARAETDYLQFQFDELENAALQPGEQELLEQEMLRLTHAEEIKRSLSGIAYLLEEGETAVTSQLKEAARQLSSLEQYSHEITQLNQRINSALIELRDVSQELDLINEQTLLDEGRRQEVEERIDRIYRLEQKHQCGSVEELIARREGFNERLNNISHLDEELESLRRQLAGERDALTALARQLSAKREAVIPGIEEQVNTLLRETGMPDARFKLTQERLPEEALRATGIDQVHFLFSANKGHGMAEISKVASGGELSRLMFCIKGLAARHTALPTIIFDEIDTGISGEVALKVGKLMQDFSRHLQVITITHLPQIAGKGNTHYFVYKESKADATFANIRKLEEQERIREIAKMLSGDNPSPSALKNAQELLK